MAFRSGQRSPSRGSKWTTPLVVILIAAVWLFAPLTWFGVWDPHEVETADLARRVGVHAFGASTLARDGDPAGIPTLADLGTGELGVTSIALSFSVFGVSDWAGRLPLALWGFAGAMAVYLLAARTIGPRAGLLSVLALLALPAFYLQARTMIGDVVPMSAVSMATAGGLLFVIERTRRWRLFSFLLFTLGVAASFMSRGLILCVVPLLAVGTLSFVRGLDGRSARSARVMFGAGVVLAVFTALVFSHHAGDPLTRRAVGMTLIDPEPATSTFDRTFRHLGHGLFPLSALLPIAFGVLSRRASTGRSSEPGKPREDRASAGRVVILAGGLLSVVLSLVVTPFAGALPFFGVGFAAALLGDYAASLRAEPPSRASIAATLLFLFVLRTDLQRSPARMLESFALGAMESAHVVEGHARLVDLASVALAGLLVLSMRAPAASAPAPEETSPPSQPKPKGYFTRKRREFGRRLTALAAVNEGNVVFAFVLIEAALVGMAIMLAVGGRLGWEALASLPDAFGRFGVAAWWVLPLGGLVSYAVWTVARDGAQWLRERLRITGSVLVGAAFTLSGGVLGFAYFPAFFDHASPRHALQRYEDVRGEGDALGLVGTSPALAPFYVQEPVTTFAELPRAFVFLDKSELSEGRHFLALRRGDLPVLNQLWRLEHKTNVPVVDASSDVLLVASSNGSAASESPLDKIVLDATPTFAHAATAVFDESVELVSWQIESASGKQVDVLLTGEPYTLRVALQVKRRPDEEWTAFVHIERKGRRMNGDHTPLGGAYAMRLWLPGDVVVDEHAFRLPPNFAGGRSPDVESDGVGEGSRGVAGPNTYRVHFGFFVAGERIPVTEGTARDNRVELGTVEVR